MISDANNPFLQLGAPPVLDDPQLQLEYLQGMVEAFEQTDHPRIKPLRKKLAQTLKQLARGAERGIEPEILARKFAADILALQTQTYTVLTAIVNEVRTKLRLDLKREMPDDERLATEGFVDGMERFGAALRKMLSALKKRDAAGIVAASAMIDAANAALAEHSRPHLENAGSDAD